MALIHTLQFLNLPPISLGELKLKRNKVKKCKTKGDLLEGNKSRNRIDLQSKRSYQKLSNSRVSQLYKVKDAGTAKDKSRTKDSYLKRTESFMKKTSTAEKDQVKSRNLGWMKRARTNQSLMNQTMHKTTNLHSKIGYSTISKESSIQKSILEKLK